MNAVCNTLYSVNVYDLQIQRMAQQKITGVLMHAHEQSRFDY